MSFGRLLLILCLLIGIAIHLFLGGEWGDERLGYAYTAGLLVILALLLFTGGGKKKRKKKKKRTRPTTAESKPEEEFEMPAAVVDEEDAGSRRERKLAQAEAVNEQAEEEDETIQLEELPEPDLHVAEEYVVDIDAESLEEADIEDYIDERRGRRAEIKERIEARRRGQLAEIRASAARMWSKHDDGEDLLAILSKKGHGLTVLDEPQKISAGHPYGATYVRIDSGRIMKIRTPLDEGFVALAEEAEDEDFPPPPPPDQMPLPPPPTASQSKLDDMRGELE